MSSKTNIAGQKFNRWTALQRVENVGRRIFWLCKCDCGTLKKVDLYNLKAGSTKSCGCLNLEKIVERSTKHGHSPREDGKSKQSRTYHTWSGMKARCNNPLHIGYKHYGGKGITYDPRWEEFSNFLEDMGEKPDGTSLDRRESSKNYCKENCRWATPTEQARNTSRNVLLEYRGEIKSVSEWADTIGIDSKTLRRRLHLGWSVEDCLEKPLRGTNVGH